MYNKDTGLFEAYLRKSTGAGTGLSETPVPKTGAGAPHPLSGIHRKKHREKHLSQMAQGNLWQQPDLSDQRQLCKPVQCGLGQQVADMRRRGTVQQGGTHRANQVPEHHQPEQA